MCRLLKHTICRLFKIFRKIIDMNEGRSTRFQDFKPRFGSVDVSVNVNLKWSCKLDYTWSKIQFLKFIIQLSYNVTVFFFRMVLLIKNFVTYLFIYIMKFMNLLTTLDLLLSLSIYPLCYL